MKSFSLGLLLAVAVTGITRPANAQSCPANIGDYGWTDGRGGDLGETLMALASWAPGCGCKLNKQWIKEWYYSGNGGAEAYSNWLKECNR